jgi:hypothetical protein
MTEEDHSETPHSDHAAHTAPAEPHPIKKNHGNAGWLGAGVSSS